MGYLLYFFRYFCMCRQFSLSLGCRFSSFVFFSLFTITTGYISVTKELGENNIQKWVPSEIFLLGNLNKYHLVVVSTKILIVDCHGVLPIYSFHIFEDLTKLKLNFECLHQYIYLDKTQSLVEMSIIILKKDTRNGLCVLIKSWG